MPADVVTANDWGALIASLRDEECLVFLGAGASTVPDGDIGLPTAGKLSEALAAECGYPGPDKRDFLRVCQYFELVRDGHRLRRAIISKLSLRGLRPGKLHQLLAELPIKCVLTTNYDNLMEAAFQSEGKHPKTAVYDINSNINKDVDPVDKTAPLVYKLHGSMDDPLSMLCTEDDIVQFIASIIMGDPPLPRFIKQLFDSHTILFVGYGLKDWNIRAMIRAMRGRKKKDWIRSFALQRRPTSVDDGAEWDHSVMYWDRKENVRCVDVEAIAFVEELVKKWKLSSN